MSLKTDAGADAVAGAVAAYGVGCLMLSRKGDFL